MNSTSQERISSSACSLVGCSGTNGRWSSPPHAPAHSAPARMTDTALLITLTLTAPTADCSPKAKASQAAGASSVPTDAHQPSRCPIRAQTPDNGLWLLGVRSARVPAKLADRSRAAPLDQLDHFAIRERRRRSGRVAVDFDLLNRRPYERVSKDRRGRRAVPVLAPPSRSQAIRSQALGQNDEALPPNNCSPASGQPPASRRVASRDW
jgi:hypothetical protein